MTSWIGFLLSEFAGFSCLDLLSVRRLGGQKAPQIDQIVRNRFESVRSIHAVIAAQFVNCIAVARLPISPRAANFFRQHRTHEFQCGCPPSNLAAGRRCPMYTMEQSFSAVARLPISPLA